LANKWKFADDKRVIEARFKAQGVKEG